MKVLAALSTSISVSVPVANGVPAAVPPASTTEPVVVPEMTAASLLPAIVMTLITLAVVAVGLAIAVVKYRGDIPREAPAGSPLTVLARRDLYGDALNEAVLMRPGQYLTRTLVWLDNRGVDGLVNGLAALFGGLSGRLRRFRTGFVRSYALSMVFGAAFVVVALLAVRLS